MCRNFVSYLRVSTAKQGASGLGIEAQQAAVSAFIAGKAADAKLLASYVEVESGRRDDRPELAKAMEHARLTGATLLIAKLDRLSRDAHFLIGLQKAGVAFVACDMPDANALTVGVMALVAQQEREAISRRAREALKANADKRAAGLAATNRLDQVGRRGVGAKHRQDAQRARSPHEALGRPRTALTTDGSGGKSNRQ